MICAACGKEFTPKRAGRRFCSDGCKQLNYRNQQSNSRNTGYMDTSEGADRAQEADGGTLRGRKRAILAELPPSAKPCTRSGYPEGLFEAKDQIGLPVFFTAEGEQLTRITGPGTISDFQLRNMRLQRTELTFPGGIFCTKIG